MLHGFHSTRIRTKRRRVMSIWRIITITFLLGCGLAFQAGAEEAVAAFRIALPQDREAIITPDAKKLSVWNIAPADFQREVTAAVREEFAFNKYSNVDSVIFRREDVIGTRRG